MYKSKTLSEQRQTASEYINVILYLLSFMTKLSNY